MKDSTSRSVKEGLGFGLLAGIFLGVMEVVGSTIMGNPPLMPVRMFASVVLGETALMQTPAATAIPIGVIVHLALSAMFGVIYGLASSRLSTATETSYGRQAAIGLGFGAMLWLVDFQIIGRIAFPWFLNAPQFLQMAMHAMFFGLPLGLMYAAGERHAHHVGHPAGAPA